MYSACTQWVNRGSPPVGLARAEWLGDVGELGFPVIVSIEHLIGIVNLIEWIQPRGNFVLELSCKVKTSTFLLVVEVSTDLGSVVVAIGILTRGFDVINVEVFGDVGQPLRKSP